MRSHPAAHAAASRTASPPSTETETPLKSMSPRRFKLGHYARHAAGVVVWPRGRGDAASDLGSGRLSAVCASAGVAPDVATVGDAALEDRARRRGQAPHDKSAPDGWSLRACKSELRKRQYGRTTPSRYVLNVISWSSVAVALAQARRRSGASRAPSLLRACRSHRCRQ